MCQCTTKKWIFQTFENCPHTSYLFPINWLWILFIYICILPLQSLPYQFFYSHAARVFGLGAGSSPGGGSEALIKVWLMVLTTMPNSSTSARRQSKKACAACLDAASDKCLHTHTHTHTLHELLFAQMTTSSKMTIQLNTSRKQFKQKRNIIHSWRKDLLQDCCIRLH